MSDWRKIRIDGISKIERVAAEFEVWAVGKIPGAKFRVKIVEDSKGNYVGFPNIRILDHIGQTVDGIAGLGDTIDEALDDALKRFFDLLAQYENRYGRDLEEDDFVWSGPEDF